jgi:hypothetical protein
LNGRVLKEDPDIMVRHGVEYQWHTGTRYCFSVYHDQIDKTNNWVAIKTENNEVVETLSNNNDVVNELKILIEVNRNSKKVEKLYKICVDRWMEKPNAKQNEFKIKQLLNTHFGISYDFNQSRFRPTHFKTVDFLKILGRMEYHSSSFDGIDSHRDALVFSGRLYYVLKNEVILSVWGGKEDLLKNKKYIFDFFSRIGVQPENVVYQDEFDDFFEFKDVFGSSDINQRTDSEFKKRSDAFKAKAHTIAGMLPVGWGAAAKNLEESTKLFYTKYCKELLLESPDWVEVGNKRYYWSTDGFSTFAIYKDLVDKKDNWCAFQSLYEFDSFISNSNGLKNEIYALYQNDPKVVELVLGRLFEKIKQKGEIKLNDEAVEFYRGLVDDRVERYSKNLKHKTLTHSNMAAVLNFLERVDDYVSGRHELILAGRLFKLDKIYVFSIWDWDGPNKFVKHKREIEEYIGTLLLDPKQVFYQSSEDRNSEFHSYKDIFEKPVANRPKDSEFKKRSDAFKAQAHTIAGMLPAGWGAAAKRLEENGK